MEKLKIRVFLAFLLGAIMGLFIYSISNNETVLVMKFIDKGIYGYKLYVLAVELLMLPMIFFTTINATKMMIQGLRNSTIGLYTMKNFILTTVFAILFSVAFSWWFQQYALIDLSIVTNYTNNLLLRFFEQWHLVGQADLMHHIITPRIVGSVLLISLVIGYLSEMQTGFMSERLESFFLHSQKRLSFILRRVIDVIYIPVLIYVMTVFGLIGSKAFWATLFYGIGLIIALVIFGGLMYGALVKLGTPIGVREMVQKIQPLAKVISKTSSSTEVLPVTISTVVNKFNVDEDIAGFVLRLGQDMNRDGTAIMQCFSAIIMAKLYGISLSSMAIVTIACLTFLLAQGSFRIPYDGIITLTIIFYFVGIPVESIFLVLGVDKGLEIIRIIINVSGDIITAVLVENWSFKQ